ncbi:OLC1v1008706C1 [Oldenlandia corymbosa var. corymbosa]|uniref:OLC1v1008706C1 n=1 Tax=Oldenlandia corymbosa var. corymbosa TaxID=529605 RepID=A0AAV1DM71_OLDCO|nr:OLC1v1008706C1 [Oldenlandia corymbosa var. corymbosa]
MKELPKSARIRKKGRKHEQIFTHEHVPLYCSKCCKIGHKLSDCRVGKPLPQVNEIEKENAPIPKKEGIKLLQSKVTWGSKRKKETPELDVEILQTQPLIVRAVAPPVKEIRLWIKLFRWEMTKCTVKLAPLLQSASQDDENRNATEKTHALVTSNCFTTLEEESTAVVDEEEEEHVEDVFIEDPQSLHIIQNVPELVAESLEVLPLGSTSPLDVGTCLDDGMLGTSTKDDDLVDIDRGSWFDGDAENAHVPEPVQGDGLVHKKHGRKSKEEKAHLLEGFMPRRSSLLQ